MSRKFYSIFHSLMLFCVVLLVPHSYILAQPSDYYSVRILQADGTIHDLQVEYPKSKKDKAKGLMFRTFLASDKGMIFHYPRPQNVQMWMENTFISLDMLFIAPVDNSQIDDAGNLPVDKDLQFGGQILHIATDTVPLSRAVISANQPVIAVIEIKAGQVGARNLKIGDKIYWNLQKPIK